MTVSELHEALRDYPAAEEVLIRDHTGVYKSIDKVTNEYGKPVLNETPLAPTSQTEERRKP